MHVCAQELAVKLESHKARHPQLLYESKLYKILQGGVGIPHIRLVVFVSTVRCILNTEQKKTKLKIKRDIVLHIFENLYSVKKNTIWGVSFPADLVGLRAPIPCPHLLVSPFSPLHSSHLPAESSFGVWIAL